MMIDPIDLTNGLFELVGGTINYLNVRQLQKDKQVRGVSVIPTVFFSAWGLWNLFYYPHLGQWLSTLGGLSVVSVNIWWVALAYKYRRRNPPLEKPAFRVNSAGQAREVRS